MDYAFSKDPRLLGIISFIRKSISIVALSQALSDVHVLGCEHIHLLQKIRYDTANLDYAKALSGRYAADYAGLIAQRRTDDRIKIRNRCFSNLKKAVDNAVAQTDMIYHADREKAKLFRIKAPRIGRKTKPDVMRKQNDRS